MVESEWLGEDLEEWFRRKKIEGGKEGGWGSWVNSLMEWKQRGQVRSV
jgi:hypothetical protein